MLKVLSIDGGGIRGIIPATVLMQLEQLTGRPTHQLFDLMAGTSTGGILTLALTCPQDDSRKLPGRQRCADSRDSSFADVTGPCKACLPRTG